MMGGTARQKVFPLTEKEPGDAGQPDSPKSRRTKPAYTISSVDNALRLLLMFRDQKQLRLSDVSTSLGVSPSTAHRLLAMLAHYDFVHQDTGHGVYSAGPALLDIGYGAVRSLDLRRVAEPVLARLARTLDETVHLAQLEAGHIRYIAGVESSRPLRVADRTGQLFPAHLTATGKAILAGLGAAQLDELLGIAAVTDGSHLSVAERDELERQLVEVRAKGHAVNFRDDGVVSVAVAVTNPRGLTVGAINASAPENRMPPSRQDEIVGTLATAAEELGAAVGHA